MLVVRDAGRAIEFYVRTLGATVLARYEHGPRRHLGHADLVCGETTFSLTEEIRGASSDAPPTLGGSPVVLQLTVSDVDQSLASLRNAGATLIFPAQDLLGERMARIRDPFGHLWLLRQQLQRLSHEEIQRQRDTLFAQFAARATPAVDPPARLEDTRTLRDEDATQQVQNEPSAPRIHLVLGPVGAGKSTFARCLARQHAAMRLTLDEWMARLFRADRPETGLSEWYAARSQRCVEQIWTVATQTLDLGRAVILEIGLLQREQRVAFYRRVETHGAALTIHALDAPRSVRRKRVAARNRERGHTFSMLVPPEIFELASDLWEPLEADECADRDVRFIDSAD